MRRILWHILDLPKEEVPPGEAALAELSAWLEKNLPELAVEFGPLAGAAAAQVEQVLREPESLADAAEAIAARLASAGGPSAAASLVVCCPSAAAIVRAAREARPHVEWGAREGVLAIAWAPLRKAVIWHETLHLLGAKDCYRLPIHSPTCGLANCIMQCDPTRADLRRRFLCNRNLARIRSAARETQDTSR